MHTFLGVKYAFIPHAASQRLGKNELAESDPNLPFLSSHSPGWGGNPIVTTQLGYDIQMLSKCIPYHPCMVYLPTFA